jgi:lysozyme
VLVAVVALALVIGLALAAFRLYRAGLIQLNHPDSARFPVRGIDVSHHQGAVDWTKVAASGVAFAYLKASEGTDWRDRRFAKNWAEVGRAGLARGAYHFFTFCARGAEQAANFLAAAPPTAGALPPVVDVEFVGNCKAWSSLEDVRAELAVFLSQVEKAWGARPILYLTSEAQERIVRGHFDDQPLWIRSIFGAPSDGPWRFWQYSETGTVPGVSGLVDLDLFRGSAEELRTLCARD